MTNVADPAGDSERLARCVKADDSTFTTFLVTPYSKFIARWAAGRSIAPTTVTVLSLALGLAAAALFAVGLRPVSIGAAIVLQVAFVADCVDGQLARYSGRTSAFGGWLDAIGDRVKEYSVYAGLAIGSVRADGDPVWDLAILALSLQLFRHSVDFGWSLSRVDTVRSAGGGVRGHSTGYWVRKSVVLPIGERFAVISLVAAIGSPRETFGVLLGWGAFAAAYALAGKAWRTLRRPAARPESPVADPARGESRPLAALRDDGPVVDAIARFAPRAQQWAAPAIVLVACGVLAFAVAAPLPTPVIAACGFVVVIGILGAGAERSGWSWLVPGAVRAAEFAVIIRIADAGQVPAAATFTLLFVLALHYYDIVYRLRTTGSPPGWWARVAGGWDGRLLVLCAMWFIGAWFAWASFAGWSFVGVPDAAVLTAAVIIGALACGSLFVAEMTRFWVARRRNAE